MVLETITDIVGFDIEAEANVKDSDDRINGVVLMDSGNRLWFEASGDGSNCEVLGDRVENKRIIID